MPGKIKVKILAGRNLPVMDRSGDTTDAYVEIKFGNTTYKTDVCRKSLNPQWNSEWYRFEVDDAELQDEPLQVRLMDHDTYSANDAIGKVYVNLNPLLLPGSPLAVKNIWTLEATMNSSSGSQGGSVMTGWIPVFDTMHGIRGEVNIIVKVELFSDCNKFRQSSCGVQFFYSPNIPHGYHAQVIHGFVEELVVSDDPEYKWIDKIRTPRASNEARQTLFFKLSGEVQRKIGLKALDLGGNAVIGYVQNFDLEGESGIVARGIGTAVTLVKLQDITSILPLESSNIDDLTCFGLQSKNPFDFSESDDSLPLLANSPNHSPVPRSPINIRATTVSKRFPKYEKSQPKSHQRQASIRLAEYRATGLRARQFSLQNSSIAGVSSGVALPLRKTIGSSLSLAEDLISESSLRNMLALEDMRGEPAGNPFSRGLKNFRYLHQNILPKRVAQIKSRLTDSLDDESEPDSNYSSTWSLAGSESNRSSIVDLRNSLRRKKFTHKKIPAGDGIAALLVRSVHSGFPLDSVIEDRETPAPSPVNFHVDATEQSDDPARPSNDKVTLVSNVETTKSAENDNFAAKKIVHGEKILGSEYKSDVTIPMISSSETDTSTSDDEDDDEDDDDEDDDEDEPSESSTNYNILDETYSLIEPNSPDERKYPRSFEDSIKISKNRENSGNSSVVSLPASIVKRSLERNNSIEIIQAENEKSFLQSRRDRSMESSTDYNILDDTSSLLESTFPDNPKPLTNFQENFETTNIHEIVNRAPFVSTERTGEEIASSLAEMDREIDEETNFSISMPACNSEFSKNYNFSNVTQSLVDPRSPDDENFATSIPRDIENVRFPRVSDIFGLVSSSYLENNQRSLDSCQDCNIGARAPTEASFDEKIITEQSLNISENADQVESILSIALEQIDESLDKIVERKKFSSTEDTIATRPDDNFDSSTDYNVLDDGCSMLVSSSFDEENFNPIYQRTLDDANFPEIIDIGDSALPSSVSQIDKTSATIRDTKRSAAGKKCSFDSQADVNSSTDYNVLEDTCSSSEACDEAKFDSIFRETMETANFPDTATSTITSVSPKKMHEFLDKIEDLVSSRRENLISSFSATIPIYPSNEENIRDESSEKFTFSRVAKSSSSVKLKHLKFLPKQQSFDSPEDLDFVTSTPVKDDSTPPDFSPFEKSPELIESKKWDYPSISPLPMSENDIIKAPKIEKRTSVDSSFELIIVADGVPENKEKQICPLGIPFDKITMANDSRLANDSKISHDTRTELICEKTRENYDNSGGPTCEIVRCRETTGTGRDSNVNKRCQRKVERTDTVIYKGPARDREKLPVRGTNTNVKETTKISTTRSSNLIPIIIAPPPEENATRLQVPVIQTTNINVQSTFSPDEMKTQHFGSIGSRKFPLDEYAISEKFNRKYRQHCMLDLIKTIDVKMMHHHGGHHERHDSTRSKQQRKKRERINASATPSPDSIHRTRQHKKRSRSRSPDGQQQHIHTRGQLSTLTTHSFPMKNSFSPIVNRDASFSDSFCENTSKNRDAESTVVALSRDFNVIEIENASMLCHSDARTNDTPITCSVLTSNDLTPPLVSIMANINLAIDEKTFESVVKTSTCIRESKDSENMIFESSNPRRLEFPGETSCPIAKITNTPNTIDVSCVPCSQLTHRQQDEQQPSSSTPPASSILPSSLGSKIITANATASTTKNSTAIPNMHRRSSDSDLSITPKGNSLAGSDRSMGGHLRPSTAIVRTMNQDTMEMLEYPFITMQQYPPGFVLNIGGLVSARSVKLLERITNLEEPEGRDAWWTEIRMEVRSHARALACNVVLGYKEEISICDDVCVLNASGTAAVINLLNASQDQDNVLLSRTIMTTSVESEREKGQVKSATAKTDKSEETIFSGQQTHVSGKLKRTSECNDHEIPYMPNIGSACGLCHLPYNEASVPFRVDVSKCSICRRAKVPDVLFTTIELPENIPMTGRGVFLQATVCKCKRDLRGELNAKEISDCLPFLEYELHSLLLNKLKVKGMNAIFGLKVQVSVGERLVIGMAVGTAVYLTALPTPSVPQIASGNSWHNEEQLAEIQKTLIDTVKKNREFYRLKPIVDIENIRSITTSDTDESDDDLPDLDLGIGTKDACVLEVDDVEDMDRINLLIDEKPPEDFHVVNTQSIPGLEDLEIVRNLQMFTQISRAKIPAGQFASMPSKYFARMLQTVLFKLRRMVPCALCDMQFKVALPEQDEIQLSVVGMALGLGEPTRFSKYKRKVVPNSTSKDPIKKTDEADLIFSLDEDQVDVSTCQQETMINQANANCTSNSSPLTGLTAQKHRPRSPFRPRLHTQHKHKHVPLKERYGVDITPLSYLPGGKIERYLGNLNFFFIRESTSIRENGGLSGFTHSFVTEILAIVRAHITALGGNAMVAFFMTQCVLLHSPHKNQGQCLINVGGDVVTVSYYGEEKYLGNQNC